MRKCPRCSEVLSRRRVAAIEVDGCNGCAGVFFDAGELSALAKQPAQLAELARSLTAGSLAGVPLRTDLCPACGVAMVPFQQPSLPGIELDACPRCKGIWLDGGEAMAIAVRRGYVEATPVAPAPRRNEVPPPAADASPLPPAPTPAWGARSAREQIYGSLLLGVLILIGSVYFGAGEVGYIRQTSSARGAVVSITPGTGWGDGPGTYQVSYRVDGEPHQVSERLPTGKRHHNVDIGDTATVRYDPRHPGVARVYSAWLELLAPGVGLFAGMILLGRAAVALRRP